MSILIPYRPGGQLGNRLYHSSHFMAFGHEMNLKLRYAYFEEYKKHFSTSIEKSSFDINYSPLHNNHHRVINLVRKMSKIDELQKTIKPLISYIQLDFDEPPMDLGSVEFKRLLSSKYIVCQGWPFKAPQYFNKYAKQIRNHYTLNDEYQLKVSSAIAQPRSHQLLVGIHIRRGDYKHFKNGQLYFELFDYKRLLLQVLAQYRKEKDVAFLICSNEDIPTEYFNDIDNCYISKEEPIIDLYMLAQCDLIIGPSSTFSAWANFYGKNKLVHLANKSSLDSLRLPILSFD